MQVSSCIAIKKIHIIDKIIYFRSTDSDVKFYIYDEQYEQTSEQNSKFEDINTVREMDLETNFEYSPHPLAVSFILKRFWLKPYFRKICVSNLFFL